jgi:cytochrome c-type biogenesis protein CcmE
MRKRSQRLWLIGAASLLVVGAIALSATALKDTVAYFYAPTDLVEKNIIKPGVRARIGGLVETGSFSRGEGALVKFKITDGGAATPVVFDGLLPDLFAEGQGIVAEGQFDANGQLVAKRVLAKHDENYMPKEVYDAMRKRANDDKDYKKEPVG